MENVEGCGGEEEIRLRLVRIEMLWNLRGPEVWPGVDALADSH